MTAITISFHRTERRRLRGALLALADSERDALEHASSVARTPNALLTELETMVAQLDRQERSAARRTDLSGEAALLNEVVYVALADAADCFDQLVRERGGGGEGRSVALTPRVAELAELVETLERLERGQAREGR